MKKHNKNLAGVAKQAGVVQPVDYAIFMDHGYRGLYGGLGMRDVRERKRLKPKEHLFDHMGSMELAANLFRATQTEEKLRRENVRNKDHANRIHSEVGRKARDRLVTRTLRAQGWRVLRIWEHELVRKNEVRLLKRLQSGLN
jgi:DNA-damage-inducible protein D